MNISSTRATFRHQKSTVLAHTHLDTSIYWISRAGAYCYLRPTPLSACMCVGLYTEMRMPIASNTKTTYTHTRVKMDWRESRQTARIWFTQRFWVECMKSWSYARVYLILCKYKIECKRRGGHWNLPLQSFSVAVSVPKWCPQSCWSPLYKKEAGLCMWWMYVCIGVDLNNTAACDKPKAFDTTINGTPTFQEGSMPWFLH